MPSGVTLAFEAVKSSLVVCSVICMGSRVSTKRRCTTTQKSPWLVARVVGGAAAISVALAAASVARLQPKIAV
ncbi:MAG: hypothetical protein EB018_08700 [Gammaproteobacteria bacterium]|nr:hypothetical protein [Gammaproteobacteria bacterium]